VAVARPPRPLGPTVIGGEPSLLPFPWPAGGHRSLVAMQVVQGLEVVLLRARESAAANELDHA
jgi:hypothetical protein